MANENNPFFWEADVDVSQLKDSLASAEKSYLEMSQNIMGMVEALETQEVQQKKTGEQFKRQSQSQERAERKRFQVFNRVSNKVSDRIGNEKRALGDLGVSWSKVTALIGGTAAIGIVGHAISSYLTLERTLLRVNVALSGVPRYASVASGSVQELAGYLDVSREEVLALTQTLAPLAIRMKEIGANRSDFRRILVDAIELGRSMDVSSASVGDFYNTFTKVYKLPHHRLRGISASMKFIQEQTGVSGEELLSFGKSLDDVLSRMTGATNKTKAEATSDMLAIAAVFKKTAGIEMAKTAGLFAEALKIHSKQGNEFLAFITQGTGRTIAGVRKEVKSGNAKILGELYIDALKRMGPRAIELNEDYLTSMTGHTFAEMTRLSKMQSGSLASLAKAARDQAKRQDLHKKRAQKLQNSLLTLWNRMRRAFEKLWFSVGRILTNLVTKIADFMIPKVIAGVKWLDRWFTNFTKRGGGKDFNKWVADAWQWMKTKLVPVMLTIGKAALWVAKGIKGAVEWFSKLSSTEKSVVGWAAAIGVALKVLGGPLTIIAAGIYKITQAVKAANDVIKEHQRMNRIRQGWIESEQRDLIRESGRQQFEAALGEIGVMRREAASRKLASYIKQGLITPDGKIGPAANRLFRAGAEAGDRARAQLLLNKAFVEAQKAQKLGIGGFARADILRDAVRAAGQVKPTVGGQRAAAAAAKAVETAPAATPTVTPAVTAPRVTPPPPPTVVIKADDPKQLVILGEIRDQLRIQNSRSASRSQHPSSMQLRQALGQ